MSEACRYLELSVKGHWVALGREWLSNNAPCSREKMFVELGRLMPNDVRKANGYGMYNPITLVRMCYKKLYGSGPIPEQIPALKRAGSSDEPATSNPKPACGSSLSKRLTEDQVREIFFSNDRQKDIASAFGVSKKTVNSIKNGRTHVAITGPLLSCEDED